MSNARSASVVPPLALIVFTIAGCASLPPSRYGVDDVAFDGVDEMDEAALRDAIATAERDEFLFWVWPWTDWELFDNTVFERDVARIERWYKARGYYHAKVTEAEVEPRSALQSDRIPLPREVDKHTEIPCERIEEDEGCLVRARFVIEEGEPVLVDDIHFEGVDSLSSDEQLALRDAVVLVSGERFDEMLYDESKRQIKRTLGTASYARAELEGRVEINPATNRATITFKITPGPTCTLGKISVAGNNELPADVILSASYLRTGDPYNTEELEEANRAIATLGAFSAVSVEPQIPSEDDDASVIDIVIKVTPGKLFTLGIGIGVQNGTMEFGDQQNANSEWDIHLLSFLEDRNFLGGFRKFRVEERPRLIFPASFPGGIDTPKPGNEFKLEFRQPDFIEARTTLVASGEWDYGPDPNVPAGQTQRPFRHEIGGRLGPERSFFDGKLFLQLALRSTVFLPDAGSISPSSYYSLFLEEHIGLDFRDNPAQPRSGLYIGSNFEQSQSALLSSWTFYRVVPEIRGYVPLSDDLVLAGRFSLGWMDVEAKSDEIRGPDGDLAVFDERLGPRILRFRSGGANSNRGYPANTVGASRHAGNGGLREWESSLELRWQLNTSWGVVAFLDMSDVDDGCTQTSQDDGFLIDCVLSGYHRGRRYADLNPEFKADSGSSGATWRWEHMHASAGLGIRLNTPIGPFRLDVGVQLPFAQYPGRGNACPGELSDAPTAQELSERENELAELNEPDNIEAKVDCLVGRPYAPLFFGLFGPDVPMAWHFSFGEAF